MKIIFIVRSRFYQQLGIMYLSSAIQHLPIQKKLCLAKMDDILHEIDSAQGKVLLAYSVMSYDSQFYIELNRTIKERRPDVLSIFGGPHPTFYPHCINDSAIDAICRGEGEWAFRELCEKLLSGENYLSVQNFWFKHQSAVIQNPPRPLDANLSKIPFPDTNMFFSMGLESIALHVFASRGCPYSCTFCYNHQEKELYRGKGPYLRFRTPQNVIDEIHNAERTVRLKIKRVCLLDSALNFNKSWLRALCALYKKEVKIPFSCGLRADLVDEETIALLKESGCCRVAFGAEVGNESYRINTLQKRITNNDLLKTAALLRTYKLKYKVFNIVGFPYRSLADDIETLKLNWRLKPTYGHASIFVPMPGSALYDELVSKNLLAEPFGETSDYTLLKKGSTLKFRNKREKRCIENLYKFFALCVQFPVLYPLVRVLIRLPLDNLYQCFHRWYVYFINAFVFDDNVAVFPLLRRHGPFKLIKTFLAHAREY